MNKKKILWGLLLIALGVVWGLNALGITNINLFFDGWWTMFIIVPCLFGLVGDRDKTGNLIGLLVGAVLLLVCQGVLNMELIIRLALPVILIAAGLCIVIKGMFGKENRRFARAQSQDPNLPEYCATFSSQRVSFQGLQFRGANVTAVFGGVTCDLTGANIGQNAVIRADSIFGNVDLIVPPEVRVEVSSGGCFGGVKDRRESAVKEGPTVYVDGMCLFGGVDIR